MNFKLKKVHWYFLGAVVLIVFIAAAIYYQYIPPVPVPSNPILPNLKEIFND